MTSSQLLAGPSLTHLRSNSDPNCNRLVSQGKPPGSSGGFSVDVDCWANGLP